MVVGSGMGPATSALVRRAVSPLSRAGWARPPRHWSAGPYPRSPAWTCPGCGDRTPSDECEFALPLAWLLDDLRDGAGADGVAAFADAEAPTLLHRPPRGQRK